jgi:glycosyltransferase involved in cell wall biosynthesis
MQLALRLGAHGFEPELAGPLDAMIYPAAERQGIPIWRFSFERGYGRPHRDAAAVKRLIGLMRARHYSLAHCHSAKAGVLGRLAARASGTPTVYSPHSFPFVGDFSELRRMFALSVELALGPLTTAILCVCEEERRIARDRRLRDASALHVVYNGCSPCEQDIAPDGRLERLRQGRPLAAAVTVLRAQKSVEVLLDAVPLVFERAPYARIAVVGEGPLRDELHEHAARLGIDRDERFAFFPFEAPASRHLRAMDVYVLPSSWEAFPIGVLEALACGVPQVATDVGGTAEAITSDTGLLVPKRNPEALAGAICELLEDPGRREAMAKASRDRHAERFGVDRMVAETASVYRRVLAA